MMSFCLSFAFLWINATHWQSSKQTVKSPKQKQSQKTAIMLSKTERYGNLGPPSYLSNINVEQHFLRLVMASQ